ncbi:hypothetical protein TrVE_jg12850 [Triparma verrucosa]|uniref:Uncharacterized protein n=1 Tax=Triparma verrucosa TaxID=1606542 RepID=A0A9W7C9C2_9STRA|nr:hypothetical protein TrVE_jg12850 [Triparma verrucosa]
MSRRRPCQSSPLKAAFDTHQQQAQAQVTPQKPASPTSQVPFTYSSLPPPWRLLANPSKSPSTYTLWHPSLGSNFYPGSELDAAVKHQKDLMISGDEIRKYDEYSFCKGFPKIDKTLKGHQRWTLMKHSEGGSEGRSEGVMDGLCEACKRAEEASERRKRRKVEGGVKQCALQFAEERELEAEPILSAPVVGPAASEKKDESPVSTTSTTSTKTTTTTTTIATATSTFTPVASPQILDKSDHPPRLNFASHPNSAQRPNDSANSLPTSTSSSTSRPTRRDRKAPGHFNEYASIDDPEEDGPLGPLQLSKAKGSGNESINRPDSKTKKPKKTAPSPSPTSAPDANESVDPATPSGPLSNTVLKSYGLIMSLHHPTTLTIWPSSHLSLPPSGLQSLCRFDKTRLKLQPGQMCFFSCGLVHAGRGRGDKPEEDEGVIITEKGECEACNNIENNSPHSPIRLCYPCWTSYGSVRFHSYIEPSKRRRTKSYREAGKRGDRDVRPCLLPCCRGKREKGVGWERGKGRLGGDMEKLGYEVWDTGVKTVNVVNVKALPRAYQPIFNNEGEPLNKKAGSRGQMSVTQHPCFQRPSAALRPVADLVMMVQAVIDDPGFGTGMDVVDPVLLYSEPNTKEQDPHRDWPRKLCLEE